MDQTSQSEWEKPEIPHVHSSSVFEKLCMHELNINQAELATHKNNLLFSIGNFILFILGNCDVTLSSYHTATILYILNFSVVDCSFFVL